MTDPVVALVGITILTINIRTHARTHTHTHTHTLTQSIYEIFPPRTNPFAGIRSTSVHSVLWANVISYPRFREQLG